MKKEKVKFYWHIHHDVLVEPLIEPIENRIKFIKENKLKDEIKLRLKLMKPVKGKLPEEFVEASQKYVEARQKYVEESQKYVEVRQKYVEARQNPQILALHKKECPNCLWRNGTIFPKDKK